MLDQAYEILYNYWGILVGALGAGGVATAVLVAVVKGGVTVLANKQSSDSAELKEETREAIGAIREDVAELKDKMYLDAKVNAENPVLSTSEQRAYHKIGTKSVLDKVEEGLDLVEQGIEIGAQVAKHWTQL